jgi:DNA-binding MarR family transcriptional regulator
MDSRRRQDPGSGGEADRSPVIPPDPLDPRVSLSSIIHWADSHAYRVGLMRAVGFPVADLPMFLVVNQLVYRGATRPSDLAEILGTGRANLTKIGNRLEQAGLIVRVPDPADERSVLLALTAAGREVGQRIAETVQDGFEAILHDWDPDDVASLTSLLARFAASATQEQRNGPVRSSTRRRTGSSIQE